MWHRQYSCHLQTVGTSAQKETCRRHPSEITGHDKSILAVSAGVIYMNSGRNIGLSLMERPILTILHASLNISSQTWQKSHPQVAKQKNSETGSIHFMQFPATLVQLAEKSPSPQVAKQGKILKLDLSISCNSSNFGSASRKASSPGGQTGKNSETGSIHFMQFPATLVQLAEKSPPPPRWPNREKF